MAIKYVELLFVGTGHPQLPIDKVYVGPISANLGLRATLNPETSTLNP